MYLARLGVALLLLVDTSLPGLAQEPAAVDIDRLLRTGWTPSRKAAEAASVLYRDLAQRDPNNSQLLYAYALVLMRQHKHDEAQELLGQAIRLQSDHLPALRASIWIYMLQKDYTAALARMELLSKEFPEAELEGDAELQFEESSAFLGRLFAYLDGPASHLVAEHLVDAAQARIYAALSTGRQQAFDDSFKTVQDQFIDLDLQLEQSRSDAREEQERIRQDQLKHLRAQQQAIDEEHAAIDADEKKAEENFSQQLGNIDRQLRPLEATLGRLRARAARLQDQIASMQAEVNRLLGLAAETPDPFEAARLDASARRLEASIVGHETELGGVTAQGQSIAADRDVLSARRGAVIQQQRLITEGLNRRRTSVRKSSNQILSQQRKAAKPVTGNTAAVVASASHTSAFTTYEPFPYDLERQRLLDDLAQ